MISIKIINCGTYNVYYLRKTPILASGYCFGEQVKCPDGQGSETGFTPGCQMLPTITVTPVVNADLEDTPSQIPRLGSSKKSYFECTFDKPSMGPYYFDITWYIHGNEVRRTRNVTYEELSTTRLLPKHWVHQYNLNMVVMCSVRVRETEGGVPTNEMTSSEYQAGIFPESYTYHIDEGQTISIPFSVTYPVECTFSAYEDSYKTFISVLTPYYQPTIDTCRNIQSTEAILFKENLCGIVISSSSWRESKVLNVTGNIDNLINAKDRDIYIRLGIFNTTTDLSGAWNNVTIPDIKIYISDVDNTISDRICKLQTDPRFWTFDGKQHDIYSAGEFVLYRHKKRNVEVHALFTACPGDSGNLGAACTCGVAIRVEDSLYVYRTCREVSYQTVNLLAHHSTIYEVCDDKHMVISTESDGFTKITLPSGTVVKYKLHGNWIRYLHIIPSAFDIDNMEGICGNANSNDADDFVAPDGRTPTSDRREDIDIIINTWKIQLTSPNSLFSANPVLENTSTDVQKYCSCATEASNINNDILKNLEDHHTAVCNITTSLVDCSHQQTTASFLTTCNRVDNNGRKRRALSEVGLNKRSKRVRRSTTDSDDVIDFEPLIYDPSYSFTYIPQIPTWRNGWNESHARQVCEESINNDHVKLECEKYIDIQKMVNHSISSCILDIRDSASTEWVAGTIDAIKSYCLTRISKYEKFYVSNSSEEKSVLEIFNAVTCINNCSKHGHCTDKGKCFCDIGFIGSDCSHPINQPPKNNILPEEGLCRQSIRPCKKTNIVGNFLSGTTIYVKLQQYEISILGKGAVINTEKTTAQYRAPNLISVVLPSSTRRRKRSVSSELGLEFDISLSYDNTNFGEELKFIIYDDSCYDCNSTTTTCTMLDSCLHSRTNSTTMSSGALPSYTGSSHTSTTFTPTSTPRSDGELSSPTSSSDQDNTKMILIIVFAVLAVALIVAAIILFLKCKTKSIKQSNPLYYNTEPVKNGCPPMNTYEDMYSRPFSPPPPYQDNRKTGRPSSSSSIRATFDETKSNHSFNFDIFSVDSKRKNL
ncbi:von Willebrand factor D and EGF domain-containing protein isoform X1 [Magallana gigas]|uniref:von Willebrand factor D and EGF domain-containing protein isoform X1 n=1 Tax=Magallana gigas TaxID=29159 RepID=UPI003340DFDB